MCRKKRLTEKYGEEFVEIVTGGYIVCPACRVTHGPGIDYIFEGEKNERLSEEIRTH